MFFVCCCCFCNVLGDAHFRELKDLLYSFFVNIIWCFFFFRYWNYFLEIYYYNNYYSILCAKYSLLIKYFLFTRTHTTLFFFNVQQKQDLKNFFFRIFNIIFWILFCLIMNILLSHKPPQKLVSSVVVVFLYLLFLLFLSFLCFNFLFVGSHFFLNKF